VLDGAFAAQDPAFCCTLKTAELFGAMILRPLLAFSRLQWRSFICSCFSLAPPLPTAPQPLHLQGKPSLFFTAKEKCFNPCVLPFKGLRESCFFPLRGGLAAWLCQGGTAERKTNRPVSSQCPVALSTLGWHLLGLTKLPQPLRDVTARCALPCLPGPGALAGILSMKETENIFIETQAAKSAKQNKVLLSGGDRDPGLLDWTSFCKSKSSILKYTQHRTTLCVSRRCQDRTLAGETGPKDEYLEDFNVGRGCRVPSLCGLGSLSPPHSVVVARSRGDI